MFVVIPIIQYRPARCKAGGGDFPGFVKPTEFGPSLLILKREGGLGLTHGPGNDNIMTCKREERKSSVRVKEQRGPFTG